MLSLESQRFFSTKFAFFFVLLYNKSLHDWSLGEQWILFPAEISMFPSTLYWETLRFSGEQNSLFPKRPVIKCCLLLFNLILASEQTKFSLNFQFNHVLYLFLNHFLLYILLLKEQPVLISISIGGCLLLFRIVKFIRIEIKLGLN